MAGSSSGGRVTVRTSRATLGAALIARGLVGNPGRDPSTGRRKSPGLLGSIVLLLFGGVFLGVGIYVHGHSAALRAQPGTKGSPEVMGWICIAIGALIVLLAGLTLISRIVALLIGLALLVAALFEKPTAKSPTPAAPPAYDDGSEHAPLPAAGGGGGGGGGDAGSGRLLPPPLDPHLPDPRVSSSSHRR